MAVYITHAQSQFDYSPALKFGEIIEVTDSKYSFFPGKEEFNRKVAKEIKDMVAKFDPDQDFLLPSGSALVTGTVFAMLALRGITKFMVLNYVTNEGAYVPSMLDVGV